MLSCDGTSLIRGAFDERALIEAMLLEPCPTATCHHSCDDRVKLQW